MVLGLVQAAHENTLHNKSVSLRLLHDLLPNFSRSQEVRSAPASTQSMVHRMRTVEHASPLHTVGAEESSVQVRRPNNFVEPSEPRTACTSASDSLSISAACVLGGSPRFFSLREEPGRSHHRATAGAPLRARLGRLLAAGARRAGLRHVVAAVLVDELSHDRRELLRQAILGARLVIGTLRHKTCKLRQQLERAAFRVGFLGGHEAEDQGAPHVLEATDAALLPQEADLLPRLELNPCRLHELLEDILDLILLLGRGTVIGGQQRVAGRLVQPPDAQEGQRDGLVTAGHGYRRGWLGRAGAAAHMA
mmetsp:Transcript_99803/g.263573  ORF Transcript_99803/g.263573 Transcript_99803/m.263573 type:complete len:307 (+) Transcript_99803:215-1135(+)